MFKYYEKIYRMNINVSFSDLFNSTHPQFCCKTHSSVGLIMIIRRCLTPSRRFAAECRHQISINKKHLKNVGPIRHSEQPHAALPFTRRRYCRVARRLRIDVHDDDDDDDNA